MTILATILVLALQHPVMGFDLGKTIHRFRTSATGGSIEVDVKDRSDADSLAAVRTHLKGIATSFASGDFTKPMQTHGEVPPGVPVMERLKAEIVYTYEDTAKGGAVKIRTTNKDALAAIHDFLQYQMREHHTR